MKKINLYLCMCLTLLGFQPTFAEENTDAARAATRRSSATSVVTNRQKSTTNQTPTYSTVSRSTNLSATQPTAATQNVRDRSGSQTVISRNSSTSENNTISTRQTTTSSARTATNTIPRTSLTLQPTNTVSRQSTRTAIGTTSSSRTATNTISAPSRSALTISRAVSNTTSPLLNSTRGQTATARNSSSQSRISRAAATNEVKLTADDIMNRDYSKCREVYYDCMDEFCANKDSQLKRCACSARVNEFDGVKKQLSEVEEKLLDFNQRLLTVNMDKEDAEALFTATEGEIAFNQEDTSDSKKALDEIAKKLNTSFDDSNFNQSLTAINLSLNADSAFDTVDSLMGASTTTKSGTELYSAALPVCREMALEVCGQDELDIVESSYQMLIEQDCNTVAKSYATQQDQARSKIFEGSALLDMSRLDIYQKRNSDDILTCKKKMLDMLTNSSVCGEDLEKCLDTTGRYIDPSTGEAFLTENLAELGNLITRPDSGQTWVKTPGNEKFVSFLNSKKKYLEPAMENCQDIADSVWDAFVEDAMAQIKLAQEKKLEDMRQSCTTLTTQCLSDTADSIEDFDARALSIFGVSADKTVKEICSGVMNACTALLEMTGGDDDWVGGMTEIATDKTYETVSQTCREVGRSCIMQACKSISGNFGLCENIQTSINRKSIINRYSCWDDVVNCVRNAGETAINNITEKLTNDGMIDPETGTFYKYLYGSDIDITVTNNEASANSCAFKNKDDVNCVYDICAKDCGYTCNGDTCTYEYKDTFECRLCRIAENLWGNCEVVPTQELTTNDSHNKIKSTTNGSDTLLYWFAKNTSTDLKADSCRDTSCGIGFRPLPTEDGKISCVPKEAVTDDGRACSAPFWKVQITSEIQNCCRAVGDIPGAKDTFGNCCNNSSLKTIKGLVWSAQSGYFGNSVSITPSNDGLCMASDKAIFAAAVKIENDPYYEDGVNFLICVGSDTTSGDNITTSYPEGKTVKCDGRYVWVNKATGKYTAPQYDEGGTNAIENFYLTDNGSTRCVWNAKTGQWESDGASCATPDNWQIVYE